MFKRIDLFILIWIGLITSQSLRGQDLPRGFGRSENPHIEKWAYILTTAVWDSPTIYVCWENPTPENEKERAWVQAAVKGSWQQASGLDFKGWGRCASRVEGIRILVEEAGPHVKALGRGLNNLKNGMVLNFSFDAWSPLCRSGAEQRRFCIESIAVHEFGHAIGFAHEQNRPDVPGECASLKVGSNGDLLLTPYDPLSVMNYCNPAYNNNGRLSELDVRAVRELYPTGPQ